MNIPVKSVEYLRRLAEAYGDGEGGDQEALTWGADLIATLPLTADNVRVVPGQDTVYRATRWYGVVAHRDIMWSPRLDRWLCGGAIYYVDHCFSTKALATEKDEAQ